MGEELFDVTIIGGGPAGLYSAFYSGLREMKTKVIEFQSELGGKVHVYPEKLIWDIGGLTPVTGADLIEKMVKQGLTFQPETVLNEKIESIDQNHDGIFILRAKSGRKHYSRTVIMAVGGGILQPQKLPLKDAERFELSNLHYTVKSLKSFKDKVVIISGGGNAAIDWANELEPIARKVYVTYRKNSFTGHEAAISQLQNSSATCYFNTSITKLTSLNKENRVNRVELTDHVTGKITGLAIDDIVINHGYERDKSLLDQNNLNLDIVNDYFIKGTPKSESSVEGLYAAGDILHYDGKLHLIAGAFQDAANAVNQAKQYIEPKAESSGMVSSHNEVFKTRNREIVSQLIQ